MITVIYDGSCRVCTTLVGWLQRKAGADRIDAQPNQKPGVTEAFGLSREQVDAEVWVVEPDGRKMSGAAGANRVLETLGGLWWAIAQLYKVKPLAWVEDKFYHWFSANRHRFGCNSDACALPQRPHARELPR
jgi:predicted DCC family thiol-disulfide oxidoreductase YuxK